MQQNFNDDDFSYEEDVLRNPYQLKSWLRYIDAKQPFETPNLVNLLYERALVNLPGSYKLWFGYLDYRLKQLNSISIADSAWDDLNKSFERALGTTMYKMPRIWMEYLNCLMKQYLVTKTRLVFDSALQHLPVTQHSKIWKIYKVFTKQEFVPVETIQCVWWRYLLLEPNSLEEYVNILVKRGDYDEACVQLSKLVLDDSLKSIVGKSKNDLWIELCEMISEHGDEIKKIDPEKVIRSGLDKFHIDVGQFWNYLAIYFISIGEPEKACDIFMEVIETVSSVRDFSMVFDAWTKFLYEFLSAKMTLIENGEAEDEPDWTAQQDLDLWTEKLEYLLEKREEYLNNVKLRQNPHNVHDWHKRVKIFANDEQKVQKIYAEAVDIIDPIRSVGKLYLFWINYARYQDDVDSMRKIFARAVEQHFRSVDELAAVWCEWIEIEIKENNIEFVRELFLKVTTIPPQKKWIREDLYKDVRPQEKIWKTVKLWSFYADFEESFGSVDSTREVYDKMIQHKIATPQLIVNYAHFLEKNKYFELSFKAYEKGISLFGYPQVAHIWIHYLVEFIKRYKDKKVERTRDLFEQALVKIPEEFAKNICLLYAKFEEDFGSPKNAMNIYDRSLNIVKQDEQYEMYLIYIHRASEYFGVTKTRDIYEKAINGLPSKKIRDICLKYADMERKLGEIDRARAIYVHASASCNPTTDLKFWELWFEFEKYHGNQETAREMLRIKRSVTTSFGTNNVSSAQMLAQQAKIETEEEEIRDATLKRKRLELTEVNPGTVVSEENPEEIELETKEDNFVIQEKAIPKALFERNIK